MNTFVKTFQADSLELLGVEINKFLANRNEDDYLVDIRYQHIGLKLVSAMVIYKESDEPSSDYYY